MAINLANITKNAMDIASHLSSHGKYFITQELNSKEPGVWEVFFWRNEVCL